MKQTRFTVELFDVMVLLYNVLIGSDLEAVGFEDTERTVDEIIQDLKKKTTLDKGVLESALWSCNIMEEGGFFWHPKGKSFDEFVNRLLKANGGTFDKRYNFIEETKDVRSEENLSTSGQ